MINSILILLCIIAINIYIYCLNFISGRDGIVIPFKGNKRYSGSAGKDGVLYRIPCSVFSVKSDCTSLTNNQNIKLYYSKGSIKPLSKFDFLKSPPPINSSQFSCSGHYLLVKPNCDDSSDKLVPFDLNLFISYENNQKNNNITSISFFVSILLSIIFFNYLNIYISIVPTVLLFIYLNLINI